MFSSIVFSAIGLDGLVSAAASSASLVLDDGLDDRLDRLGRGFLFGCLVLGDGLDDRLDLVGREGLLDRLVLGDGLDDRLDPLGCGVFLGASCVGDGLDDVGGCVVAAASFASLAAAASAEPSISAVRLAALGVRVPRRRRHGLDDRLDRLGRDRLLGGLVLGDRLDDGLDLVGREGLLDRLVLGDGLDDAGDLVGREGLLDRLVLGDVSTTASIRRRRRLFGGLLGASSSTTSSTSAAASCWRTWAKAEASVLSIPPSGSWTASDIE